MREGAGGGGAAIGTFSGMWIVTIFAGVFFFGRPFIQNELFKHPRCPSLWVRGLGKGLEGGDKSMIRLRGGEETIA